MSLFRLPRSLRRIHRDVDDEIRFHIDSRIGALVAGGMSPDDARRTAEREYGDVAASRAELTEVDHRILARERWLEWMDSSWQHITYAMRGLRARPAFAIAVVITLALGIGANAAIFSVVDRLLFRLPPLLREPALVNRLYAAFPSPEHDGQNFFVENIPWLRYQDIVNATRSFTRTAGYSDQQLALRTGDDVREVHVGAVSASFFDFFDAPPALGRYFNAAEDMPPSGALVVVLSYGTWQTRYAGRSDALGATLQIGPATYTVVGVAPEQFVGVWTDEPPVAFIPVAAFLGAADDRRRGKTWFTSYDLDWATMLVERKRGVSIAAANADLTAALRRSWKEQGGPPDLQPHGLAESILTERGPNQRSVSRVAALVGGMAFIVLMITCANVASLLLARALRRRREIAVRLALGVSRARLLAQLLTESVLLAVLGGIAGLVVAHWGSTVLGRMLLPAGADTRVLTDTRTLGFVGVPVLMTGILTGLAPAWLAVHVDVVRHLKNSGHGDTLRTSRARMALLVVQGALSVILLVGAGLFVRSLNNVKALPLGYDADRVLTVALNMRDVNLDSGAAVALRERLLATAMRVPGVEHAALHLTLPFVNTALGNIQADSLVRRGLPNFRINAVTPDYFATMGTRILRGRGISTADASGAPAAVVVSKRMANLLWPGRDALGQCVREGGEKTCRLVVGIAEDIKGNILDDDTGLHYYYAAAQFKPQRNGVVLRMRGDAASGVEVVRRTIQREMPGAASVSVTPFANAIEQERESWRLGATMFSIFGALALVLAAIGLYSTLAYSVTQRSHEMGVRIALGAQATDVIWLVVRQGLVFGGAGVLLGGVAASIAANRFASLLFSESPRDPVVYASVGGVLLTIAAVASAIPARRAARVDPNVSLRSE